MTPSEAVEAIIEDRNRFYEDYHWGPFKLTFGLGLDPSAPYWPDPALSHLGITLLERVHAIAGMENAMIFRDRNFQFAYMVELL